ncbi:MAG: hypothetical protein NTX28_07315 [Novosphingobium sp.]|nr:hypothetical protein [Novosphingobium sp.]
MFNINGRLRPDSVIHICLEKRLILPQTVVDSPMLIRAALHKYKQAGRCHDD